MASNRYTQDIVRICQGNGENLPSTTIGWYDKIYPPQLISTLTSANSNVSSCSNANSPKESSAPTHASNSPRIMSPQLSDSEASSVFLLQSSDSPVVRVSFAHTSNVISSSSQATVLTSLDSSGANLKGIHSLAYELLAKIFLFSVDEKSHIQSILSLCHTCRYWREVATGTCHLWSHLRIPLFSYSPDGLVFHRQMVKLLLSRSGSLPLNIYLYGDVGLYTKQAWFFSNRPPLYCVKAAADYMKPFLFHESTSRWESLTLRLPISILEVAFLQLPAGIHFPSLCSIFLSISFQGEDDCIIDNDYFSDSSTPLGPGGLGELFSRSTNLRTIILRSDEEDELEEANVLTSPLIGTPPWQNLTYLDLDYRACSPLDLRAILLKCCSLLHFKASSYSPYFAADDELHLASPHYLSNLTTFSWSMKSLYVLIPAASSMDCSAVLHSLFLPSLSHFELYGADRPLSAILSLYERSCFPITSLSLNQCAGITSEELRSLLRTFQTLEILRLFSEDTVKWLDRDLVRFLHWTNHGPARLPRLHTLEVAVACEHADNTLPASCIYQQEGLHSDIVNMVRSRWINIADDTSPNSVSLVTRWSRVRLSFYPDPDNVLSYLWCETALEVEEKFFECIQEGMDLEVKFPFSEPINRTTWERRPSS
ncbi:hypothetical protein K435DRAFT_864873 [Dendrothele bispora CBS 962.96]|uniref:F-box domain-containing protein n=1 Tax=Dendrothele bispora (strain CBS 962.96) TaxID=1314807 RepID=A0A4S8LL03_DENBC|nr:hypothetical protein K435DRAFT_864873 [Dendrothele bispora CBS 962.96]